MNEDRDIFLAANLGSEVTRLLCAKSEQNAERIRGAYERARVILRELETTPLSEGGKTEVALLKQVIEDVQADTHKFSIQPQTLQDYFMPFARRVLSIH